MGVRGTHDLALVLGLRVIGPRYGGLRADGEFYSGELVIVAMTLGLSIWRRDSAWPSGGASTGGLVRITPTSLALGTWFGASRRHCSIVISSIVMSIPKALRLEDGSSVVS